MSSNNPKQAQSQVDVQRKSLLAIVNPNIAKHPSKSTRAANSLSFVTKFNSDIQKSYDNEYQSKNSHLFTWKQKFRSQNKIKFLPGTDLGISQTDVSVRENTTDVNDSPKALTNMNFDTHTESEIDGNGMHSSIQALVKKEGKRKNKNNSLIQEYDETLQKILTSHKKGNSVVISDREKSSYSITRLQTDLLSNRSSPLMKSVCNFQFMSNQFDRKNYNINKIINKITIQNEMIDRNQLKEETIKKLKYVSKGIKLNPTLKPENVSVKITRPSTFMYSKSPEPGTLERLYQPEHRTPSPQRSSPNSLQAQKTTKVRMVKFIRESAGNNTIISQNKGNDTETLNNEQIPPYRLIQKPEIKEILQKASKLNQVKKLNPSKFFKSVDNGLKGIDIVREHNQKTGQHLSLPKSVNALVKVKFRKRVSQDFCHNSDVQENDKNNVALSLTEAPKKEDDNIFRFNNYFKNHYLEQGVNFEISKDLREKIKTFGKEVNESAKKIHTVGAHFI